MNEQRFPDFIKLMKGLDIKRNGLNVCYWQAHLEGWTSTEIKLGKTPFTVVPEEKTFHRSKRVAVN